MKNALGKKIAAVGIVTLAFAMTVPLVAGPAASQTTELTFSVIQRETGYFKLVDTGRKGPSAGDTILEIHPLYDPETDERLGKASTRIDLFRFRAPNGTVYIDCEVTLPDGTIVFAGEGKFSQLEAGISLAVTGGTGAFAGAGGTATVSATGEEGTFLIAFDLVR